MIHHFLTNAAINPLLTQRFATPAANGSVHDFQRLLVALDDHPNEEERYTHCLPVFYAALDPARIPPDDDLRSPAIRCAIAAFDALRKVGDAHKRAWPDLWPRMWAWIVFLHAYQGCCKASRALTNGYSSYACPGGMIKPYIV
ncbi:hypothetical protein C8R47DRAFT_1324612 [Mycena vitilis]|nr:hypothetical protein C8R47DRAFT_1324612 [Mycena vitilis]